MALHKRLFFLLLVLLPTQLGLHFWPSWVMILGRRIDYLSPTIYVTDVITVFVLLFWIREKPLIHKPKTIISIALFVGLNVWFAASRPVAIYAWIKVLEYVLLGWYIVQTKPKLFTVMTGLSVAVFYTSIIAIMQFAVQHSVGGPLWWLGERTFTSLTPGIARLSWCIFPGAGCQEMLRAYGTFPHPNVLGGFLAVTLPILISQIGWIRPIGRIKKIVIWLIITLGLIALVLTFSRSAWVVGALGVGITYYARPPARQVLWYKHNKRFLLSFSFILLIVCIGLIVAFRSSFADESFVRRTELNQAAFTIWQRSPLVGVGLGNFLVLLPDTHVSRQGNFLQPVHNVYLLVLSETGIIGLIVFLVLISKRLWVMVYRIWDKTNTNRYTIYEIPFTMLLLLGLVDHYLLTLQQGQLLFTLFAAMSLVSTSR